MGERSRPAPVDGVPTQLPCPHCKERKVLLVYQHEATGVMFCAACEYVFTVQTEGTV